MTTKEEQQAADEEEYRLALEEARQKEQEEPETGSVLPASKLTEEHRKLLISKYGIPENRVDEYIEKGFVWSGDPYQVMTFLDRGDTAAGSGICIQFPDPETGKVVSSNGARTVRLDIPYKRSDDNGKPAKYLYPKGQPCVLFSPSIDLAESMTLYITEGVFKSICGFEHELPVLGLGGIWNYTKDKELIDTLKKYASGRKFVLIYDSDIVKGHPGYNAFPRLAEQLYAFGSEEVRIVTLPDLTPGGDKTGLDEFIIAKKDQAKSELENLVDKTTPYEPTKEGRCPKALAALQAISKEDIIADPIKSTMEQGPIKNLQIVWQYNEVAVHKLLETWKGWNNKVPKTGILDLVKKVHSRLNKEHREEEKEISPANWVIKHFKEDNNYELWHTEDKVTYITIDGRHLPIKSSNFDDIITTTYNRETADSITKSSRETATDTLKGWASFGKVHEIEVRVARRDDKIYLDMANDARDVIEITKDGWKIIKDAPVRFRRSSSMQPLPYPMEGGNLDDLRVVMNLTDEQWILVKGYIVGLLSPYGSYAVLVFIGEGGRLKTRMSERIKKLVDPCSANLFNAKVDQDTRTIIYSDNHVVPFDNVRYLDSELSDEYCRVSTGIGIPQRQFYTQKELILTHALNPLILNGIRYFVTQTDLMDRDILIEPPLLTKKLTEQDADSTFSLIHPQVLGALLDMTVTGLNNYELVDVDTRMSDFARWSVACLGDEEGKRFKELYEENKHSTLRQASEGNLLIDTLVSAMKDRTEWVGTATELLAVLNSGAAGLEKPAWWPKHATAVSNKLNDFGLQIRANNLEIERIPHGRNIRITHKEA